MPRSYAQCPTAIGKVRTSDPVEVREPGPKTGGLGSGLVGDCIGDQHYHSGTDQAVYAFAREVLDDRERRLGRELPDGMFGENLTTAGLDVDEARIGEPDLAPLLAAADSVLPAELRERVEQNAVAARR